MVVEFASHEFVVLKLFDKTFKIPSLSSNGKFLFLFFLVLYKISEESKPN